MIFSFFFLLCHFLLEVRFVKLKKIKAIGREENDLKFLKEKKKERWGDMIMNCLGRKILQARTWRTEEPGVLQSMGHRVGHN